VDDFEYGPVEILLIGFEGDKPGQGIVDSMIELIDAGTVQLLDLTFIAKSVEGDLTILELDVVSDDYGLGGVELEQIGLTTEEDLEFFADELAPGTSAAVLVVEHTWARTFASRLAQANGVVIDSQRIPAPIINAALADAEKN
jgi:hypothetical protein